MYHNGGLVRDHGHVLVGLHSLDLLLLHAHGLFGRIFPAQSKLSRHLVELLRNAENLEEGEGCAEGRVVGALNL